MSDSQPEEGWEAEIGELLSSLPAVDPPDGFIAAALDHRPLGAVRTMASLLAAVVAATAASLAIGVGAGRIFPAVDDLSERHLRAAAGLEARTEADGDGGVADTAGSQTPSEGPFEPLVSQGYEPAAIVDAADLRQAVYERDGRVVSVFEVAGSLDWDQASPSGRTTLGTTPAWVDEEEAITIVETGDGLVAIVGLPPGEVAELLVDLPTQTSSVVRRAEELASAIARQIGFPG